MNPSLFTRALKRHHYMRDKESYRALLSTARAHGNCWMATQSEVAAWWRERNSARVEIVFEDGSASVSLESSARAVLEIDGELQIPPLRIPIGSDSGTQPHIDATEELLARHGALCSELLGHLGYRHVQWRIGPSLAPGLPGLLGRLAASLEQHQRFVEADLATLRTLFQAAHHRVGLPDIRVWTLPHRAQQPYRVALSPRFDVDKAIVNLPDIHAIEHEFGARSTVYLRPMGLFYGRPEIQQYVKYGFEHEIALHGEFVTTAETSFGDEFAAARMEKRRLESFIGRDVYGVCMHGGELRSNTTPYSRAAIEQATYLYETMYRNRYYHPIHLIREGIAYETLSIGQHFADISVPADAGFGEHLTANFVEQLSAAADVGGVFVPVMHPLYFGLGNYLKHPINTIRFVGFLPRFLWLLTRVKKGSSYTNAGVNRT